MDDPNNVDGGVELITEIIDHLERYEQVKNNARKFIVENFDWNISAAKMERLYFTLCS